MQSFVAKFGMPLLARELIQLAARRRTYVVRVLYAVVLYGAALWFYRGWVGMFPADSFEALGQGKPLFEQLVRWQFLGIYLFLPAMTCGAITSEKERQTLPLLRLTKLSGWTILIEKLVSRLMEMGTFLLLPLPLAAMSYGLGGVEVTDVVKAVYVLSITALQVGCFALLCSTWFRTTAGAMVGVYLIGAAGLIYGFRVLRMGLLCAMHIGVHELPWPGLNQAGRAWFQQTVMTRDCQPLSGPWVLGLRPDTFEVRNNDDPYTITRGSYLIIDVDFNEEVEGIFRFETVSNPLLRWLASSTAGHMVASSLETVFLASIPLLLSAVVCLVLARIFLWRRSEAGHVRFLQRLFAGLDWLFVTINRAPLLRGVVFGGGGRDLPDDRPVAWYERRQRLVGRTAHWLRILLAMELPLFVWFAWQVTSHPWQLSANLSMLWIGIWLLALLVVIAVSTGLVAGERSRQTLDVLLATPLAADDIVRQKMAGLGRLIGLLCVPLLTVMAFQLLAVWSADGGLGRFSNNPDDLNPAPIDFHRDSGLVGLGMLVLRRVAAIGFYLPLAGWLGFQLGLRLKNQYRAIIAALLIVLAVCGAPPLVEWYLLAVAPLDTGDLRLRHSLLAGLSWMNPWFVACQGEEPEWRVIDLYFTSDIFPSDWFPVLFHFAIVGGMLWTVRRNALRNFSRFVRRMEPVNTRHVLHAVTPSSLSLNFNPPDFSGANHNEPADAEPNSPSPRTNDE